MRQPAHALPGAALGVLVTLVVLWRLVVAVRALPEELAALAPGRVAASLTTPLEERVRSGLPRGVHELYSLALLTPPEARIQVPRPERSGIGQGLRTLCFPRRIESIDPGPLWRAEPGTYLLKLATLELPSEGLVLVERRGTFELWRAEERGAQR